MSPLRPQPVRCIDRAYLATRNAIALLAISTFLLFGIVPAATAKKTQRSYNQLTRQFKLNKPKRRQRARRLKLWATYYYLHSARARKRSRYYLKNSQGKRISPRITRRDWCYGAMEGSIRIRDRRRRSRVYNYIGMGKKSQLSCYRYFPRLSRRLRHALEKSRFRRTHNRYGDGVKHYRLIPFRTIAVDPTRIPYGSIIYIPAARGLWFHHAGRRYRHDGYFFAGDTGGAIKQRHIDVFSGTHKRNPFRFIRNKSKHSFTAYIIRDKRIHSTLWRLHSR